MHDHDPIDKLGLGCPFGGNFYICRNSPTRFIGCCSSNPCGSRKGLCPDEHLRPASFEAEQHNQILDQACISDNRDVRWYSCAGTTPPFLGCCAVNPCARGRCPDKQLRAAKLSDRDENAEALLDGGPEAAPEPRPGSGSGDGTGGGTLTVTVPNASWTTYTASVTVVTTTRETGTVEPERPDMRGYKGLNVGQVVGIVLGPIGFVILVLSACFWILKLKKQRQENRTRVTLPSPGSSSELNVHHDSPPSNHSRLQLDGSQASLNPQQERIRDTQQTQPHCQRKPEMHQIQRLRPVHTSLQQLRHPRSPAPGQRLDPDYDPKLLTPTVPRPRSTQPQNPATAPASAPRPSTAPPPAVEAPDERSGGPPGPAQQRRPSPSGRIPQPGRNHHGPTHTAGRTPLPRSGMAPPNPAQDFGPGDRPESAGRRSGEDERGERAEGARHVRVTTSHGTFQSVSWVVD
ncbi:hypothetical protein ACJ41O_011062 [Fusarium nematophilum]